MGGVHSRTRRMTPPPHSDARTGPPPQSPARTKGLTSPAHSDRWPHLRWAALLSALLCAACGDGHSAAPPASANAPAAVTAPSRDTTAPSPSARYDLTRDERRGGHTLARHVGRSDAELR